MPAALDAEEAVEATDIPFAVEATGDFADALGHQAVALLLRWQLLTELPDAISQLLEGLQFIFAGLAETS